MQRRCAPPPRGARPARPFLFALLCFALAGCGPDAAPPPPCAVRGIDVSRHQGTIDWAAVARAGVRFAWMKATEGGDYLDPTFRRNWALAGAAGLRRGAYHFVYWCRPGADQARWFTSNVPDDPDALPPVLDIEWNPASRTCPGKPEREEALATVRTVLAAMERATGRRPILYAPSDIFREVVEGALPPVPLWVRGLGRIPPDYGGGAWQVWQHSETGIVPGIAGGVDLDCARTLP